MATMHKSTERLDQLHRCVEAYGADPARWPAAQRDDLAALLEWPEAADILSEAQFLDGFLNAATAPRMSEDLSRRIMANYRAPAPRAGIMTYLRGLAPGFRLVPAGALAGFGALGLASGIVTASAQEPLAPEYEALAYVNDLSAAPLDENGDLSWDAD
jgi:hypothetical protein